MKHRISEKDREINRLNGLLEFHKSKDKSKKIDKILVTASNKCENNITLSEVIEPVNLKTGELNFLLLTSLILRYDCDNYFLIYYLHQN